MGQGLHTKMRQVAASALGVPLATIRLAPTRTDKVPNTSATAASSGSDLNCAAVQNACTDLRERLAVVAADMLGTRPAEVRFVDGAVSTDADHRPALTFADVVAQAYVRRVQLSATGFHRTEGLHWDTTRVHGNPFKYFAYGAAVAEVEVDGFTGANRVLRV